MAGVRSSDLKSLRKSPAHMKWSMENEKTTKATQLGTLVHTLFLEPEEAQKFVLRPLDEKGKPLNGNSNAYKKEWKPMIEEQGLIEVTQGDLDTVNQILLSLERCEEVQILREYFTQKETSLQWTEEVELDDGDTENVLCKLKFDAITSNILIDVKTTTNAHPFAFSKQAFDLGYHVQAVHYLKGLKAKGYDIQDCVFLVTETKPPYITCVYKLSPTMLEAGEHEWQRLMKKYAKCVRENYFPGYSEQLLTLDLPSWAYTKLFSNQEITSLEEY